jgi:hypothetical protein
MGFWQSRKRGVFIIFFVNQGKANLVKRCETSSALRAPSEREGIWTFFLVGEGNWTFHFLYHQDKCISFFWQSGEMLSHFLSKKRGVAPSLNIHISIYVT